MTSRHLVLSNIYTLTHLTSAMHHNNGPNTRKRLILLKLGPIRLNWTDKLQKWKMCDKYEN